MRIDIHFRAPPNNAPAFERHVHVRQISATDTLLHLSVGDGSLVSPYKTVTYPMCGVVRYETCQDSPPDSELPTLLDTKVEMEPCCECCEDYPRAELLAGHIYCAKCRAKDSREAEELHIDQAARGCCSGRLIEWPVLQRALASRGIVLPGWVSATFIVKQICRDLLERGAKVARPETRPCCECGEEYPQSDFKDGGHLYCAKCRESEQVCDGCGERWVWCSCDRAKVAPKSDG